MGERDYTDAEYEVITGPSPVEWQKHRRRPAERKTSWFQWAYAILIALVAGYTLLLGLAGADLDTRDAVSGTRAREPVAATFSDAPTPP